MGTWYLLCLCVCVCVCVYVLERWGKEDGRGDMEGKVGEIDRGEER